MNKILNQLELEFLGQAAYQHGMTMAYVKGLPQKDHAGCDFWMVAFPRLLCREPKGKPLGLLPMPPYKAN